MWEHLQNKKTLCEDSVCGKQLRYEALLGDKTLDYLLARAFYERTVEEGDVSHLHSLISSRSNNEKLREQMDAIGLVPSGNEVMDASRVEQVQQVLLSFFVSVFDE